MGVRVDLNVSLDGYATTEGGTPDNPMGEDWNKLTAAYAATRTFRERVFHDTSGEGTTGIDDRYAAAVSTANTRLERRFDPGAVHDLKAASSRDLIVGGPNLAAQALKAGLVDECQLFIWPVVLGGRNRALPTNARARAELELLDERRFNNGVVHLRYRPI